ncbi:unnamed protein product [Rhodiola kirilowii]
MAEIASRKCFNRSCSEVESTRSWNGWRLGTGEYCSLCDSCSSLYEEGRFCEVFHSQAPGWVPCESCNKHIHCGCIVSIQTFTLLDAGGIACITCAKRSGHPVLPGNLTYSAPPYGTPFSERIRDLSTKTWSHISGVGPIQWREAPNKYNSYLAQPEAHMRMPLEMGMSNGLNRYTTSEVFSLSSLEKRSRWETDCSVSRIHVNGNSGMPPEMLSSKEISSNLRLEPILPSLSANESNSEMAASGSLLRITSQTPKQFHSIDSSDVYPSIETPIRNGRLRGDGKSKNQLLARYLPRTTDEELQKLAGSSEIKPLFEKTLSASDAGRIGRLVVPKKCAEAYFPNISQPEGLPLKVQDVKGKEWVFQFRFWPNNNSRMYVLEGVSAYIQSMQLLAGDKVTFSRLEPEGRLVMGFRKASNGATGHDDEQNRTSNIEDAHAGINLKLSKADKSGYIAKDIANVKSSFSRKRKSTLSSKDRNLLFEGMDLLELKITLEEAQRLMRPSSNDVSRFVIAENEIEEYEDCPVIGKPTIFTTDQMGESIQWAQCEECLKWRQLPADVSLSAKWTCSNNIWDSERCTCSSPQDISADQLDDLLSSKSQSVSKKAKIINQDVDAVEALEGLDALANLAILGEGQAIASSGHITTKHPRHRIGCSCIVCIQPPSGKGLKHKHTCECTVCLTVKRRFQTLMLRREKKQQGKASEKHQENDPLTCEDSSDAPTVKEVAGEGSVDISCGKNASTSSLKGQIDLNMKPERDDPLISSELNTLRLSSNVAESEDEMKASIHSTIVEVTGDPTQTVGDLETSVDGADNARVTNQQVATPPADAHPEKETTVATTSG